MHAPDEDDSTVAEEVTDEELIMDEDDCEMKELELQMLEDEDKGIIDDELFTDEDKGIIDDELFIDEDKGIIDDELFTDEENGSMDEELIF